METRVIKLMMLLIVLAHFNTINAQNNTKPNVPELDSELRHKKLKNGFEYYIKPTSGKDTNVYLSLIVKAGTNHEDKDQLELSHFLEHLAFKSTENIPEGIHAKLGESNHLGLNTFDVNGHPSPKATYYTFKLPSDNKEALDLALLWFEDIAKGKLKLMDQDIEKEKGPFIQEYVTRGGDNFQKKLQENRLLSLLVPGRKDKSTIFQEIQNWDNKILKRFYKKWYRPDLMALSIVGGITNADSIATAVHNRFSTIPIIQNPEQAINYDSLYYHQENKFARIHTGDSLNSKVEFQLFYKDKKTHSNLSNTEGAYRIMQWNLLIDILNERFKQNSFSYNSFFTSGAYYTLKNSIVPPSLKILINSEGSKYQVAIKETMGLLKQLSEYGVTKKEFQEVVDKQMRNSESLIPQSSRSWITNIQVHIVSGEALLPAKPDLLKKWLSDYSREDFNSFISDLNFDEPENIGVLIPYKYEKLDITESLIRDTLKSGFATSIEPYTPLKTPEYLMSEKEKNKLSLTEPIDLGYGESGAREIRLKNGIKVILNSYQPEGLNKDKIFVHGFTPLGAMNFPEEDYFSALNSADIVYNSGVDKFSKFELQQFLLGRSPNWFLIDLYVNNLESGIKMHSEIQDLEYLFQLVYLYMQKGNASELAFEDWKKKELIKKSGTLFDVKNQDLTMLIKAYFGDRSGSLYGTKRYEGIEKTRLDDALNIYKQIFQRSEDFTFILSGNFPIDSVLPLATKYLGNLPVSNIEIEEESTQKKEKSVSNGPVYKEYGFPGNYTKKNNLYKPFIVKKAGANSDWKERIKVEALGAVTDTKIWDLRFKKGYPLYDLGVGGSYNVIKNRYEISGNFNTDPAEVENIRVEFKKILRRLRTEEIPEDLLKQSLARMMSIYNPETGGKTHRWVQDKLYKYYRFDLPWVKNSEIYRFIRELTPADIMKTAKKYYKDNNLYEFVIKSKTENL